MIHTHTHSTWFSKGSHPFYVVQVEQCEKSGDIAASGVFRSSRYEKTWKRYACGIHRFSGMSCAVQPVALFPICRHFLSSYWLPSLPSRTCDQTSGIDRSNHVGKNKRKMSPFVMSCQPIDSLWVPIVSVSCTKAPSCTQPPSAIVSSPQGQPFDTLPTLCITSHFPTFCPAYLLRSFRSSTAKAQGYAYCMCDREVAITTSLDKSRTKRLANSQNSRSIPLLLYTQRSSIWSYSTRPQSSHNHALRLPCHIPFPIKPPPTKKSSRKSSFRCHREIISSSSERSMPNERLRKGRATSKNARKMTDHRKRPASAAGFDFSYLWFRK